jgi:hypothetical protein
MLPSADAGVNAVEEKAAALETGGEMEAVTDGTDGTVEPKPRVLSPLERIELPTGASLGRVFARGWKGRRQRIVMSPAEGASYHIMSRTAGGERLLGDTEKEALRRLMWRLARFAGVEIRTYAVMDNHFHILARVPSRDQFVARFAGPDGEARLMEHLRLLYSSRYIAVLCAELTDLRQRGMPEEAEALIAGYLRRFCNLPVFVKELKERFSRWYNERRSRRGTLWMERFKSVLVEDGEAADRSRRHGEKKAGFSKEDSAAEKKRKGKLSRVAALPGAVFFRRAGAWIERVRGRGVSEVPQAFRAEAEERGPGRAGRPTRPPVHRTPNNC